jgi:2'-5' RNA ligase
MNRQFIAVVPEGLSENKELKQLLGKLKRTVDEREKTVRWVAPSLWHVTLRFLGDLQADGPRLREWFLNADFGKFDLTLRLHGLGAFPATEEARVLWIGVSEDQPLLDLQTRISEMLSQEGFPQAEREAYKPHLTIGRFRNAHHAGDLIALGGRKHFGDYPIKEVVLFESVIENHIVKYSVVERRSVAPNLP